MCCLYGMMDYKKNLTSWQKTHIISVLSAFCEARGTDATGHCFTRPAADYISINALLRRIGMRFRIPERANLIMGHTRMTHRAVPSETTIIIRFVDVSEIQ